MLLSFVHFYYSRIDMRLTHLIDITCLQTPVANQYQSQIYLARASFDIKTQSEARLESEVLIVHVMAEVVCLQVRLETRKCIALS